MTVYPFNKIISIDKNSSAPLYRQLANSIKMAIREGKLQVNDVLPSINELSFSYGISRDTAEKGYKYLKALGILGAISCKAYYVKSAEVDKKVNVLVLFNHISSYKKIIYDSFVNLIGDRASIDFHIYNNDISIFKKKLQQCHKNYDYYIIIPPINDDANDTLKAINALPKEKLILVDRNIKGVTGKYSGVFENFEKDIFQALEQALQPLRKYHTINIVFPENNNLSSDIIIGYRKFCYKYGFEYKVIADLSTEDIKKGVAYITLDECDLVTLVERITALNLESGKQVGVISYNETPLKKIIMKGVTTISTDFKMMGEMAARLILNQSVRQVEVQSYLTLRNSL